MDSKHLLAVWVIVLVMCSGLGTYVAGISGGIIGFLFVILTSFPGGEGRAGSGSAGVMRKIRQYETLQDRCKKR